MSVGGGTDCPPITFDYLSISNWVSPFQSFCHSYLYTKYPGLKNKQKTRAKSSNGTCDEARRAKSTYGMSSNKILRINILI